MELDPLYCDVIVERWENFTGKQAKRITNEGGRMIYLASPYSHEDQSVRENRFQAACKATARC